MVWALEKTDTFELVSCSQDKSIKIWNVTSGKCIRTLLGHTCGVFRVRMYAKDLLVCGSLNKSKSIKLLDLASDQCILKLDGHKGCVSGFCFI